MSKKSTFTDNISTSLDCIPSLNPRQEKPVDVPEKRLVADRQRKTRKRRIESVSDREKRLRINRDYMARVIRNETTDQRSARLQRNREYKAKRRSIKVSKSDFACMKSTIPLANIEDDKRKDRMKCQHTHQMGNTLRISEAHCHLSLRSLHQTQVRVSWDSNTSMFIDVRVQANDAHGQDDSDVPSQSNDRRYASTRIDYKRKSSSAYETSINDQNSSAEVRQDVSFE